jgi:hypothetical protein
VPRAGLYNEQKGTGLSMVDNNDALFREVHEELRREQFAKLWQRYGTYIIGLGALVILIVAGAKYMEGHRLAASNAAGAEYEAAATLLAEGKAEDAAKAFDTLASNGPKGYAALAALSEAGAYLKLDKRPEALAVFDKLADNAGTDRLLADFARVQAASLRLGEADFTEMENRLKPLTADSSPWRFTARELLGTAALKAGKLDQARETFSSLLADPGLTRSASERLDRLMADLASRELATKPAAAPTEGATPAPAAAPAPAKDAEKPAAAP